MHKDLKEVLLTEEQIRGRVCELGKAITKDYAGKTILMCCILKGAVTFYADLARTIRGPVLFDFMSCSSYGASSTSSGQVHIRKDLDNDVRNKDVLIVEDIIDTGVTLSMLLPLLKERGARSVKLATLLSKPARRQVEVPVDYNGFEIPDAFVVGYGLDYAGQYRNLPYIGVLREDVYEK
ncbi:hypoxanthine phosphoribosyltransferase [Megasphaera cerevisiae DSM 20462]|jgi:hypoxanthine phosphoribosyltransferase|uniref:Hypoxanthine phosphoribosyltransferase n=1 Tax=Megasphaera cerevisiae DSM 20462 TaxID=1122219 RepID=A0A0J6WVN8_9FIRM|nr:hypoxanthine phosphoribosyltransferase [Megasphaera cerevisiae]KMO85877.1 hypoxanthine phosphoribosyltransferase [Megasphaera cerevisiae DSM 20462]OKY53004.1 hypoxanthine phosphoribosyltransferase [Megasphaera cerevisiae]SJZ57215.1 hypoxanthine phosphoribosyltransferase [Megasphaera cerevisiae DSM 20462]